MLNTAPSGMMCNSIVNHVVEYIYDSSVNTKHYIYGRKAFFLGIGGVQLVGKLMWFIQYTPRRADIETTHVGHHVHDLFYAHAYCDHMYTYFRSHFSHCLSERVPPPSVTMGNCLHAIHFADSKSPHSCFKVTFSSELYLEFGPGTYSGMPADWAGPLASWST